MKRKNLFLILLSALLLCGCGKISSNAAQTPPIFTDAPTTLPAPSTVPQTLPATVPTTAAQTEPITVPTAPEQTVPAANAAVPTQALNVSITKNPTGETVAEGESAVFIARADHAEKIVWIAVSPDTKTVYELDQVPAAFAGLRIDGQGTEKLTLSNIPYAMNGWRIQCYFTGPGGPAYTKGAYITVNAPMNTPVSAPVNANPGGFEGIITQYQTAVRDRYDAAQMMELGLNYMVPECLQQDERARVGYSIFDMDGDGQTELVISASSESEYYTGLIFAAYGMENGSLKLLLESGDRNRWYYAGVGKLLYITSASASESGWYLCTADRNLSYLDAVEYNAGERPDDPWLKFTGETWEHTTQSEADRKIMELTSLVFNLEMTAY